MPDMRSVDQLHMSAAEALSAEVALLAGRLADMLTRVPVANDDTVASGIRFLRGAAEPMKGHRSLSHRIVSGENESATPIERVAAAFALSPVEIDLVLLAGMAEEHEGFASLFRTLHPRGEPRPTAGLATQLICGTSRERLMMRELLTQGSAIRSGALVMSGEAPFFEQTLTTADGLWLSLAGLDTWPTGITSLPSYGVMSGLEEWLSGDEAGRGAEALRRGAAVLLLLVGEDESAAVHRAAALAAYAGIAAAAVTSTTAISDDQQRLIALHAAAQGVVPIYRQSTSIESALPDSPMFVDAPGPVILCARDGSVTIHGERPVLSIRADRLSVRARTRMWATALPELMSAAPSFASRYSLGPHAVEGIASDTRERAMLENRPVDERDVIECVRQRSSLALVSGVRVIHPTAQWNHLILSDDRQRQLREALDRLTHQMRVLDDWGFLAGRPGARGVRVLFAGPPGTGKTLAAEVLANTLGVDLLVVDLARVVSKWIGETEKNLANVFDAAERTQAVLLFDEADALFGKRTDVSDAHDRYANLETAYLLSRLERFDGLAILSTNLRDNIDSAFTRRLEFVVEFDEPSVEEREALWRCHVPDDAPLATDVRFDELASLYPIVGGLIRNASVAAGFLASSADSPITRSDLVFAVRREYEKSGRAFPGAPAGTFIG
jgi:SpoVK/Ycf46/Vps4 family AAA+-type ATPase